MDQTFMIRFATISTSEDFAGLVGDNVEVDRYQNRLKLEKLDEWIGVGADNNRGQQIQNLTALSYLQ